MTTVLRAFILLLVVACPLAAQNLPRWETGAQLVRLDLNSIGESPLGVGGRIGYQIKESLAVEAEINHFPKDPSNNFGHTQILAGARCGLWFGPVGLFVKARPGMLDLGGGAAARNPGREDHFALDLGGGLLVGRGRVGVRLDAGDTMIFWGNQPFNTGLAQDLTRHNRQLSIGLAIRF